MPDVTLTSYPKGSSGSRNHLPELDSLRGLAACVVLLNHFHQVWMGTHHPAWISRPRLNPLLWLLVNGHASVILFFLLSGFVLALQKSRSPALPYCKFAVRRICRIYLPYLAGLAFALLACTFFWGRQQHGPEIAAYWSARPDIRSIQQHLVMLMRFDVFRYNVAFWSLVHEMRISLLFPLIWYAAKQLRLRYALAVSAGCTWISAQSFVFVEKALPGAVRMTAFSYTLSFCGVFLLGAVVARNFEQRADHLAQQPSWLKAMLLTGALVLYLYPPRVLTRFDISDFFVACGALIILGFSLVHQSAFARCLRGNTMQFLGRISYSLYLLHYPILLVLAHVSYGRIPFAFVLLPYLTITLPLAALAHKFIERPAMVLGRMLAPAARTLSVCDTVRWR